ncbi:MAG: TonB-dependent receptor [Woeseiaceae bacterium]|nr:TonB-dependent receptor [Woeseiaceae bacterium]
MTTKNKYPDSIMPITSIAAAVAIALATGVAEAQQSGDGGDETVEEIVVTGSRLVRRDFTAPSPITSIDRDTILSSGQPTLETALNNLPQAQPNFSRASNNPGDGSARIDLRGIGPGRTLVMLNGRRVAPAGIGSAVDVNTLPGVLMQRVEVITGGATTVYGSDAIAGVVNFITRDDFEGFGLETSYYSTERGDSEVLDINVTWGHNFGKGNITLFGGYLDRERLFQSERSFSAQTISDNWFTGMLEQGGSPTTPAGVISFPRVDFGNGPARTTWDTNGDPREFIEPDDRYDYAPVNYLQVPLERYTAGALLNYEVTGNTEIYGEFMFTHNEVVQSLAPSGTFGAAVQINTDNPVLTPANAQFLQDNAFPIGPGLVGIGLSRRLSELGPRVGESEDDYTRLLVGLRGELTATWEFDAWVSYTKGEETNLERNDGSFSRLQQGLLVDPVSGACLDPSNGCVPLNIFGEGNLSEAGADFIRAAPYVTTVDREQTLVSAFVRGEPFELPAGKLSAAIGVEWREDTGDLIADEALFSGDTLGFRADSNVVGTESVSEVYAETLVPLLSDVPMARYLGLELGGRLSSYDKAGQLETWKVGTDWEPVDGVRFRAMFQRSARAPNLSEAFQIPFDENGTVIGFDPREDPCSASADPVANGFADVCIEQGVPADQLGVFEAAIAAPVTFTRGGNTDLAPEIAETLTAGVVLTTFDTWTLAVDYFEIDVEDTIGDSDPMLVCWDPANTDRVTCDSIDRNPLTFDINAVDERNANLGKLRTKGVDTQLNFGTELTGWAALGTGSADLDVSVIWTHVLENSIQADPATTAFECVGKFGFTCDFFGNDSVFPENRVTTNIAWNAVDWQAILAWRWIEGTDNSARDAAPAFAIPVEFINPAIESIGSRSYLDLSISHNLTENVTVGLTVANLLDESPAFMADNGQQANTDTEMYDVFGRAYTLRLALRY